MSVRSLNKVILIGNLTRDPELRFTPAGTAVSTFGLATNRSWTTQTGETKEETEFHRIVAWNKLAELCSQLLSKGRKVYVEGRLATHSWTAQDGAQRSTTEVVIDDMIILDSRKRTQDETGEQSQVASQSGMQQQGEAVISHDVPFEESNLSVKEESGKTTSAKKQKKSEVTKEVKTEEKNAGSEEITPDDIPF